MKRVLPAFDFSPADELSCADRFAAILKTARSLVAQNGYQDFSDFPCVPNTGATDDELAGLETTLGIPLPKEYRSFLKIARYIKIDDGCEIGGFDSNGVYVTEHPWISDRHKPGHRYLVFANYWMYADGDQMVIDVADLNGPVYVYLHDHAGLIESYAPSFSLAAWRLVHEYEPPEEDG
jgi:hypothetical protein